MFEKTECKRLGYEYKDLFEKVVYFIHHTPFAKDFISDNDLKMLSDLSFKLATGECEIIEFGRKLASYDIQDRFKKFDEMLEQYSHNDYYYKYNGKYLKSEIIKELKEWRKNRNDNWI